MTRVLRAGFYTALVLAFAFAALRVPAASAEASDSCAPEATISSLQTCVAHASSAGFITNQGVSHSLLATLDAAQSAATSGQPHVAANIVQAFILEAQAQRGKFIETDHADDIIAHAELVIQALGGAR